MASHLGGHLIHGPSLAPSSPTPNAAPLTSSSPFSRSAKRYCQLARPEPPTDAAHPVPGQTTPSNFLNPRSLCNYPTLASTSDSTLATKLVARSPADSDSRSPARLAGQRLEIAPPVRDSKLRPSNTKFRRHMPAGRLYGRLW